MDISNSFPTPSDEDDLCDIMEELVTIMSKYYSLGLALRLRDYDLNTVYQAYPNESDNEIALKDVLLLWLHKKYNVERFGQPTWRMLVEAVDKETGGNNHDLAKKVASNHPAGINMKSACLI